jgi:hypothetical protein
MTATQTDPTINHPPLAITRLARWLMEPTLLGDGVSPTNRPAIELGKQLALALVLRHGEEKVGITPNSHRFWHMDIPDKDMMVFAEAAAPSQYSLRETFKLYIVGGGVVTQPLNLLMERHYGPEGGEAKGQFLATEAVHPAAAGLSAHLWYGEGSAGLRAQASKLREALKL